MLRKYRTVPMRSMKFKMHVRLTFVALLYTCTNQFSMKPTQGQTRTFDTMKNIVNYFRMLKICVETPTFRENIQFECLNADRSGT